MAISDHKIFQKTQKKIKNKIEGTPILKLAMVEYSSKFVEKVPRKSSPKMFPETVIEKSSLKKFPRKSSPKKFPEKVPQKSSPKKFPKKFP